MIGRGKGSIANAILGFLTSKAADRRRAEMVQTREELSDTDHRHSGDAVEFWDLTQVHFQDFRRMARTLAKAYLKLEKDHQYLLEERARLQKLADRQYVQIEQLSEEAIKRLQEVRS